MKTIFQEYDRSPEEDSEAREKEIEIAIENLNIIATDLHPKYLEHLTFSDFHIILDILDVEDTPICDFGIYVSRIDSNSEDSLVGRNCECNIEVGDMVIFVEDEDMTNMTSAHLNKILRKYKGQKKIPIVLGRRQIYDSRLIYHRYSTLIRKYILTHNAS